ncbi:hypothetical protein N9F34_00130 [Alphaproteobacteria bacterium]|nr:hypothetical protein [Alphaproteobacteria bacterium]
MEVSHAALGKNFRGIAGFFTPTGVASAKTIKVSAVMASIILMKLDFQDGSKHIVLLVQREGTGQLREAP